MNMLKKNYKLLLGLFIGLVISGIAVTALTGQYSSDVGYDNSKSGITSTNMQDAIDELYRKASSNSGEQRFKIGNSFAYYGYINSTSQTVTKNLPKGKYIIAFMGRGKNLTITGAELKGNRVLDSGTNYAQIGYIELSQMTTVTFSWTGNAGYTTACLFCIDANYQFDIENTIYEYSATASGGWVSKTINVSSGKKLTLVFAQQRSGLDHNIVFESGEAFYVKNIGEGNAYQHAWAYLLNPKEEIESYVFKYTGTDDLVPLCIMEIPINY